MTEQKRDGFFEETSAIQVTTPGGQCCPDHHPIATPRGFTARRQTGIDVHLAIS